MKKIILQITFIIILLLTGLIALKTIDYYLPAIQFFIDPTNNPTKLEQEILKKAYRNPSPQDFDDLYQYSVKYSRSTPYIEIGKCSPYPRVAKVNINTVVTFKNSDTKPHTIIFKPKSSLSLAPNSTKTILLDFYHSTPTPQGYKCDNSLQSVGILFVVEENFAKK